MNNFKKITALLLVLMTVFALSACGNASDAPASAATQEPTADPATEPVTEAIPETAPAEDGLTTYTVTVLDEAGNPVVGAMVQMCKDSCLPGPATDAEGKTQFNLAADTYKVSFIVVPAGYTYVDDVTEFYFEDGATELTITLKAAE